MLRFFLFVFILPAILLFPQSNNYLLFDSKMSPNSSSPDLLLLHHAFQEIEDDLVSSARFHPNVKRLGRAAELLFIWQPINELMISVQHEVFGHGFVGRDLPVFHIDSYHINVPFPYGPGGGETVYSVKTSASVNDLLLMSAGGVTSTAVLANWHKYQCLEKGFVDGREATLYIGSEQDLTFYLLTTHNGSTVILDGNDIVDYIKWLGINYPDNPYSLSTLQKLTLVNFIDPVSYYALISILKYIFIGDSQKAYMIPAGSVRFLPNLRMDLAPFGPEFYIENFLSYNENLTYFYLKGSWIQDRYSAGLGIEYPGLYKWRFLQIGFRADFWKQTDVESGGSFVDAYTNAKQGNPLTQSYYNLWGLALSALLQQQIPGSPVSLFGQIGAKTKGFLPGEGYPGGAILRFGLAIVF